MAIGTLVLEGSIDLAQFWPDGSSDADTTKVLVTVGDDGFRFRPSPGSPLERTTVFDGATVKGAGGVKPVLDKSGRVTVRLQGIDAPELHYRPQSVLKDKPARPKPGVRYRTRSQKKAFLALNEDYRQNLAETATVRLATQLAAVGSATVVACAVTTQIDEPNEAFDTYGRLIGDITVGNLNINDWLVESGWSVPAFYSSMAESEITRLTRLARDARAHHRGLWPHYSQVLGTLDVQRTYRRPTKTKKPKYDAARDQGLTILPKLFRRQVTWTVNRTAKMVKGAFAAYLAAQQADVAMLTDDYLENGASAATLYPLASLVSNGRLTVRPEQLVIREKPSTLIPAAGRSRSW